MSNVRSPRGMEIAPYTDFVHPASIAEVQQIVRNARAAGAQIRVRGAMHSESGSVLGDGFARDGRRRPVVNVMTDRMIGIRPGSTPNRVVVEAGVSLGGDPHAPGHGNPQRAAHDSLFHYLASNGLALTITGGISHQTISGFLQTGSAGGSVQRSLHDVIERLTFVDGTASVRHVTRADPDFPAALVSLGLLGILCEVELSAEPTYGIRGLRSTQRVSDCDVDLFHDPGTNGRPSLREYLTTKPVSRLLWWPQPGVSRVELWEAHPAPPPTDAQRVPQELGVIGPVPQLLARTLYAVGFEGIAPGAGEGRDEDEWDRIRDLITAPTRMGRLAAKLAFDLFARSSSTRIDRSDGLALLEALFEAGGLAIRSRAPLDPRGVPVPRSPLEELRELVTSLRGLGLEERLVALAIQLFVQVMPYAETPFVDDDGFVRRYAAEYFHDTWWQGLPMDDPMHDRLLPVQFTEVWLPLDRGAEAMRALDALFQREGLSATGTFTIEVYAAKRSPAFLSAAYEADVLRIDPFRYDDGDVVGRDRFFAAFHETLAPFGARFHWAKALSKPWSTTGVAYRRAHAPRWDDFLARRAAWDPDDLFLTRYWAEHLGIVPSSS